MRVRQLRDRCARTLQLAKVSHAEVEGHSGEEAQPRGLIEVFPGKLAELILEFLWRVNALLYQKSIHRINCRPETLFARESLHRLIEADEFRILRCPVCAPFNSGGRHKVPQLHYSTPEHASYLTWPAVGGGSV